MCLLFSYQTLIVGSLILEDFEEISRKINFRVVIEKCIFAVYNCDYVI